LNLEKRINILKKCKFLSGADKGVLADLAKETKKLRLSDGDNVITKGDTGDSMYFIASGSVRVHDGDVDLAQLNAGEVFGEMAVLDNELRSASVTVASDSILLSLDKDSLWKTVSQSAEALKSIIAAVLQRERNIVRDVTSRTAQLLSYEKELEIGRRIQADFLPDSLPEIKNWEVAAYFEAAREVAGDFYDVFELSAEKYFAFVIGDVCDKGVGAALFMTLFRSLIRASCQQGLMSKEVSADDGSLDHVEDVLAASIATTNGYIATTHSNSSMFASVFFGVLNRETGQLSYINGGHESPVIFRAGEGREILEVTGGILGLFPWANYSIASVHLHPGDLIFTYTDGVNEARNEEGDQFGDDRIFEMENAGWTDGKSFQEEILARIHAFRGAADQSDDITMLSLMCEPE
jgi:serine phosphatase RsbU (regulator of sigma subunit)